MKLLFDEGLSPKLVGTLADLFPESESALQNGLAGQGDRAILVYAIVHGFTLVTTDRDFEALASVTEGAAVIVLRSCNYPTAVATEVLRRSAIRIATLIQSGDRVIVLER